MIRAQLTPAQWTAWQILQAMPDSDLLNRPCAALAVALQISSRVARQYLEALHREGLASRVGTQGICIVHPAAGSVLAVATGTITAENRYGRTLPGVVQTRGGGSPLTPHKADPPFAVRWRDPDGIRSSIAAVVFSVSDQETEENAAKLCTPAGEKARRLKKAHVVAGQGARARKKRAEDTPEGREFASMYADRRRKMDPGWPGLCDPDIAKLGTALRRLGQRKVGRRLWECYLDHVFEGFQAVTKGRCIFPPPGQVASPTWIDSYVATLGERPRDVQQVHRMLLGASFKTDRFDAWVAVKLADRKVQGKTMPPDLHEDPNLHAMVEWLAERMDEIDYYDDLDGDVDAGKH